MNQVILLISLFISACSDGNESKKVIQTSEEPVVQQNSIDTTKIINEINNTVRIINGNTSNYAKVEKDLFGQSSEGGVMMAYYSESILKKVKATYYREMGQATFEYYLNKGEIIFIHKEESNYDKPMYFDDSKIKSVDTNEYYFFNGNPLTNKADANQLIIDFRSITKELEGYEPQNKTIFGDTVRCKYGSRCQDTGYVIKGSRSKGRAIHVQPPTNKNVPIEQ